MDFKWFRADVLIEWIEAKVVHCYNQNSYSRPKKSIFDIQHGFV
jgi:hypothetical protein